MRSWTCWFGGVSLLVVAGLLGCGGGDGKKDTKDTKAEEEKVKARFKEIQVALKDDDADKFWLLLDDKTQADAEKALKSILESHKKSKAEQEARHKLKEADFAALTPKTILFKCHAVHEKYHDIEDSTLEKVVFSSKGDEATVHYKAKDGDSEKLLLVKQQGEWKAYLAPIPR